MEEIDKDLGLVVGTKEEAFISEKIEQTEDLIMSGELNLKLNKAVLEILKDELENCKK